MTRTSVNKMTKGAFTGAIGGLMASWVMTQFQMKAVPEFKRLFSQLPTGKAAGRRQLSASRETKKREPATIVAAEKVSENLFHYTLLNREKGKAGEAVHYVFGASVGALYGALAQAFPRTRAMAGLPFGAAVFLVADEGLVPALGLSGKPSESPASIHLYALLSHLVYGLTLDLSEKSMKWMIQKTAS